MITCKVKQYTTYLSNSQLRLSAGSGRRLWCCAMLFSVAVVILAMAVTLLFQWTGNNVKYIPKPRCCTGYWHMPCTTTCMLCNQSNLGAQLPLMYNCLLFVSTMTHNKVP